jgi:hypothetical protein
MQGVMAQADIQLFSDGITDRSSNPAGNGLAEFRATEQDECGLAKQRWRR